MVPQDEPRESTPIKDERVVSADEPNKARRVPSRDERRMMEIEASKTARSDSPQSTRGGHETQVLGVQVDDPQETATLLDQKDVMAKLQNVVVRLEGLEAQAATDASAGMRSSISDRLFSRRSVFEPPVGDRTTLLVNDIHQAAACYSYKDFPERELHRGWLNFASFPYGIQGYFMACPFLPIFPSHV